MLKNEIQSLKNMKLKQKHTPSKNITITNENDLKTRLNGSQQLDKSYKRHANCKDKPLQSDLTTETNSIPRMSNLATNYDQIHPSTKEGLTTDVQENKEDQGFDNMLGQSLENTTAPSQQTTIGLEYDDKTDILVEEYDDKTDILVEETTENASELFDTSFAQGLSYKIN